MWPQIMMVVWLTLHAVSGVIGFALGKREYGWNLGEAAGITALLYAGGFWSVFHWYP